MEFLSKILEKLKPKENWNSLQEEKSINLSKRIRLLIKAQGESNKFIKRLLALNNTREISLLIRGDAENDFLILGADSTLFKKLLNEYPSFYLEYSRIIDNLLKEDNLAIAIRNYGTIPILMNLSLLFKKGFLSEEKYLETMELIYSPRTIKSIVALAELIKKAISNADRQEVIQIALEQGLIDVTDLAYDQEDINILKNFIKKGILIPNDKYSEHRIYDMFIDLKHFVASMKQVLSPILNNEIKEIIQDTKAIPKEQIGSQVVNN